MLIRSLRKEKQMTQLELAERMNISDKTISKWERGLHFSTMGSKTTMCQLWSPANLSRTARMSGCRFP